MNNALESLIHGAVLRVLEDNGVTDPATRTSQIARAMVAAERSILQMNGVPLAAIERCLADAMTQAVANGADSRSLPDYMVEVATWVACQPREIRVNINDVYRIITRRVQMCVDGLRVEAQSKSQDWKDGVVALVLALQKREEMPIDGY